MTSFCSICCEEKPTETGKVISRYFICEDCYNLDLDKLPKDLEIKLPKEIGYYCHASYAPLRGTITIEKDFVTTQGEDKYTQVMIHEFLHDALLKYMGWEACLMWDNVSGAGEIEGETL